MNDNELNCGGFGKQQKNDGECFFVMAIKFKFGKFVENQRKANLIK